MSDKPVFYDDFDKAADMVIERTGGDVVLGIPLGLGKPVQFVNALYRRAKADPKISLKILTALSLKKPAVKDPMERRFVDPMVDRLWKDYEDLDYSVDMDKRCIPSNIQISEFFFLAGTKIGNIQAQSTYICTNYTHAPRDIVNFGCNVLAQQIATREGENGTEYSLSCNPEVTLDMIDIYSTMPEDKQPIYVGMVNNNLPFTLNDALFDPSSFDILIDSPEGQKALYVTPHQAVALADYGIGLHVSTLIPDGGTLQVGIGSLGDAIAHSLILRHRRNADYQEVLGRLQIMEKYGDLIGNFGGTGSFDEGIYGCSEMFVEGLLHLEAAGILKRKVFMDHTLQQLVNEKRISTEITPGTLAELLKERKISPVLTEEQVEWLKEFHIFKNNVGWQDGQLTVDGTPMPPNLDNEQNLNQILEKCLGDKMKGFYIHAGFFLGSEIFYNAMKAMSEEELAGINMTRIGFVNDLFGDSKLKTLQRQGARFVNTTFMMHTLGASTADALENGQIVSGVGGQYNFVAQAHEMPSARSIIMCRAYRHKDGVDTSNMVWSYGHVTIPRHLRDIYVTEYGIADIRGKTDRDTVAAMVNIADSRFQDDILSAAKANHKIEAAYQVPEQFRHNTPDRLKTLLGPYSKHDKKDVLPDYPFGCELTPVELQLAKVLPKLKDLAANKMELLKAAWKGYKMEPNEDTQHMLERMDLANPQDFEHKMVRWLIISQAQAA